MQDADDRLSQSHRIHLYLQGGIQRRELNRNLIRRDLLLVIFPEHGDIVMDQLIDINHLEMQRLIRQQLLHRLQDARGALPMQLDLRQMGVEHIQYLLHILVIILTDLLLFIFYVLPHVFQ